MTTRFPMLLLLPLLLAAVPAEAKSPAGASRAEPQSRALAACLAEGSSSLDSAHCYGEELQRLQTERDGLLREIRAKLASPGADGTNHDSAAGWLEEAQKSWESYAASDCRLLEDVFGAGSAAGLASADCEIRHSAARNQELSRLLRDFLN
ncbi:DUF1311 domain-containing protein [Roseomonas aerophila]|uniref:DUF1311 domain-containing protein n=1 Tax=Teichococcus aerophilus TaxID=1224513 RepID=A0ABR7RPC4_9PROT|nr:lysozyme inhibitor LprI family protein [Pseudoroseomonas aerophila]MBC9208151.1 DUF1311 domain-containing protein [Pseudoroseomonas aerophila]